MDETELEAKDVYILMKKEFRISRNIRAEWYLNRINKPIVISRKVNVKDFHGELDVVSVLPQEPPPEWDSDTAHEYKYLITEKTQLHFLSRKYRLVFCLDLSPSLSIVNVDTGKVVFDEIFPTLEKCIRGVVRPFYVPGSQLLLFPKVYITIIAHTPFFKSQPQQVIVQGWLLMNEQENLHSFLKSVRLKIIQLQNQLAALTRETTLRIDEMKSKIEDTRLVNGSEFVADHFLPLSITHPMVSPDIGFVNMLRYGIMGLQLLPENSMAGIIVITDGVISLPDATMFDALLVQLRNHTISCSFLQIGPSDPPNIWGAGLGYVPFNDLMHFLANATFGAYLTHLPSISDDFENEINEYHRAFLTWGFQKGLQDLNNSRLNFYGTKSFLRKNHMKSEASVIVRKQEWRSPLAATLNAVLSCRLREGYFIKQVKFFTDNVRLILVLPWKYSTAIEYHIFSSWPPSKCEVETEVWIEASYEFLNDVSNTEVSGAMRSQYRQRMVAKYRQTLKDLKETDLLLVSLQSFPTSPQYFTVPDCVQKGTPVFYMGSQVNTPVPSSEFAFQSPQFMNFWLPVSMLNINKWQKWMHTHRIGIILKHESPLPKNLHVTNSSGRYGMIQSRHSEQTLTALLAKWTDFILLEGNSYVKFLYKNEDDISPSSFFVVRITSKRPPILAIHLAFLGGTSGQIRNKIVNDLKKEILQLTLRLPDRLRDRKSPSHSLQKIAGEESHGSTSDNHARPVSSVPSCSITNKPIEKILICHDRTPANLFSSQVQDTITSRFANSYFNRSTNRSASNNQALLCRYLHHRRWIWGIETPTTPHIPTSAITRILNTLTRIRLQEGFKFAYSFNGIVTMVREFYMKLDLHEESSALKKHFGSCDITSRCVVQYIMFPPHFSKPSDSSFSYSNDEGEDDSAEADGETQLITECWVEPQNGVVDTEGDASPNFQYQGLNYKQISQSFFPVDQEVIWSLLTFECLTKFCQDPSSTSFLPSSSDESYNSNQDSETLEFPPPIQLVPFSLHLTNLLRRCQREEILLSTLFQDFYSVLVSQNLSYQESESDKANHDFYSLILDHLNQLHNEKQFYLSSHDNLELPKFLNERSNEQGNESPFAQVNLDCSSQQVPKWRCFLKYNAQNHFLITLVPSTYRDLKLLLVNKANILKSYRSSFQLLTKIDDVNNIKGQFGEILEGDTAENDTNGRDEKENSPASHQSFTSSSGKSSRSSSTAQNVNLRRNSLSSRQLYSSDSPAVIDPSQKRTRYKSGPALIHQDICEYVDSIEPSVRERARSLHSNREDAKVTKQCRLTFNVKTKEEGDHASFTPLKDKQESWVGMGLAEKQRKRYISMPAKAHREMSSIYNKPISSKSISVEMMKDGRDVNFLGDDYSKVTCGASNLDFNQPRVIRSHTPIYGSVTLPIYVFDCRLNALISQFVNRETRESVAGKDIYVDSTFKTEEEIQELKPIFDVSEVVSIPSTEHEAAEKHPSPEPLSEESDISVDSKCLRNFGESIEKCHRRSFVMGVFDALSNNLPVNELDVQAALDQCQEVYLETNISDYLQIVCGHLKDFRSKINLEQKRLYDSGGQFKSLSPRELRSLQAKESHLVLPKFPLNLLKDYQPNTDLVAIHTGIQQRFLDILLTYFKPVPNLPDYYFYYGSNKSSSAASQSDALKYKFWSFHRRVKKKSGVSSLTEEDQQDYIGSYIGEEETLECEEDREKSIEFRSEAGSCYGYPRFMTQISQQTHLSDLDEDGQMSVVSGDERPEVGSVPPLFLHLTCTIRIGSMIIGTTPIRALPTCLGDISECIKDVNEVDLSKLSVALEVLIMTLLGGATISTGRVPGSSLVEERDMRKISFCSSNSAPHRTSESTTNSCSDNEEVCIEGEELLCHLPADQQKAISVTFEKICWLVHDEIVSSLLQCYPVTECTLELVASHVSKSQSATNCLQESVPLKFVYGVEQSMNEFMQEFKKMKIDGYQLEAEGEFHYLALNQIISRRKYPSSLIPPLSIRNISLSRSNSARESKSQRVSLESTEEAAIPKTSLSSPDVLKSPFRKLQQRVSFEGDNNSGENDVSKISLMEFSEKGKWIQRRERKERRDSEKRLVLGSSDSDSDSDSDSESEAGDVLPIVPNGDNNPESINELALPQDSSEVVAPEYLEVDKVKNSEPQSQVEHLDFKTDANFKSARRKIEFPETDQQLKENFKHIEMLAPKPIELIRCGSINIPHTQSNKTEVIRKSASTDDFCPSLDCTDLRGTPANSSFWSDFIRCNRNNPLEFFKMPGETMKSRHSSGGDILKSRHNSGTGSLLGGLQSDVSSILESGQTTDIGCEGDISNSDDCSDWLQDFEGVEPLMPDFWLIIKISNKRVQTYFHCRHEVGFAHWKSVQQEVVRSLRELVKLVNQRLLLINLHETKVCNHLLELETSEDIWRIEDFKDNENESNDYLEASMKFELGAFACSQVWSQQFELHPRLKMCGKGGIGMQSLQAILNHFSVINRKNMFVCEDTSGVGTNVFYFRLHEQQSQTGNAIENRREEASLLSRSSSISSLSKRVPKEDDVLALPEPRPRVSSFVEQDVIMEGVPSISGQRKNHDFIVVTVFGIAEPGIYIKEKLVQMLQKRLDEAVLDAICLILWNNRHSKLTPEDVHFLQPPYQSPTRVLKFTVNGKSLPYLQAVSYYLRQNMQSSGFTQPKYTDNRPENHFQDFNATDQDPSTESNIFLFVCPQKSGAKGIACIAYSVVDSAGNAIQHNGSCKLSVKGYEDLVSEDDFAGLTETTFLNSANDKRPEALAILQFKIWESGRLDCDEFFKCLSSSISHALWDLSMEYRFLVTPISPSSNTPPSVSQPNSPTKVSRQFGSPKYSQVAHPLVGERSSSPLSYSQIENFSKAASRSPLKARHSVDLGKEHITSRVDGRFRLEENLVDNHDPGLLDFMPQLLHPVYAKLLIKWLEFGCGLNVPSVRKHVVVCPIKSALPTFMTELHKWSSFHLPDSVTKIFKCNDKINQEFIQMELSKVTQILKISRNDDEPPDLLITNRNEKLWWSTMHEPHSPDVSCKGNKNMKFQSCISQRSSGDSLSDLTGKIPVPSPTASQMQQNFPTSNPAVLKQSKSAEFDYPIINIHRQMFLLGILSGQELTVYTYNWMKDLNEMLQTTLNRLCQWTTARSRLLSSLAMQKLGLFHNQPFVRKETDYHRRDQDRKEEANPFLQNWNNVELLIKSPSLGRETVGSNERSGRRNQNQLSIHNLTEVLRDAPPAKPLHMSHHRMTKDLLQRHGLQMAEITKLSIHRAKDRRILQATLQQLGASSPSLSEQMLLIYNKHCRIIHFCLTPLLFLPSWREKVAAARDHSLDGSAADLMQHRSRHESGKNHLDHHRLSSVGQTPALQGVSPTQTRRRHPTLGGEDKWHDALCLSYLKEFIQYLYCLGFVTLCVTSQHSHKGNQKSDQDSSSSSHSFDFKIPEQVLLQPTFLVKKFFDGIVVLKISFQEPYFSATVSILESSRNQYRRLRIPSQIPSSFIDEVEMIRILLHMHSFTYDYHLRAISVYVANRQLLFAQGYHLSSFLADFIKYYNKGPNFGRNLIHAGFICINNTGTPGEQLYNYLLAREKDYHMRVLRMTPIVTDPSSEVYTEFVLVHTKSYQKDSIDYEVTLLVSLDNDHPSTPTSTESNLFTLCLKFYVILTSRRDMYPTHISEKKSGRFKTVSTALALDQLRSPTATSSTVNSQTATPPCGRIPTEGSAIVSSSGGNQKQDILSASVHSKSSLKEHCHRQSVFALTYEPVNYLGYFSEYEVFMQQILQQQVNEAHCRIVDIFNKAKIHCRRDSLWQRLISGLREEDRLKSSKEQLMAALNYAEFTELLSLVNVMPINKLDEDLVPFLTNPISFYQSLSRIIVVKYNDRNRILTSPDGNTQHVLVFSVKCPETCMMLSIDLHTSKADISCVQKQQSFEADSFLDCKSRDFFEEFINCCCFNLWSGLI